MALTAEEAFGNAPLPRRYDLSGNRYGSLSSTSSTFNPNALNIANGATNPPYAKLRMESTHKPDAALKADPKLKSDASLKAAFKQSSLDKILEGKSPKEQATVLARAVEHKVVTPGKLAEQLKERKPPLNWDNGDLGGIKGLKSLPLKHISMNGANLGGQDLSGIDLEGAQLKGANLRGANLSGSKLGNADMTNADLREAKLVGADVGGTKMANVKAGGIDMTNAKGAAIMSGDFGGANLSGADLRGSKISGNFEGATLTKATLPDMKDANLKNAVRNDVKALDTKTAAEMNAGVKTNLTKETLVKSAKPANLQMTHQIPTPSPFN